VALNSQSSLLLQVGVVQLQDSSVMEVDDGSILVTGGQLYVNDQSELWLTNESDIKVEEGFVRFSGTATMVSLLDPPLPDRIH